STKKILIPSCLKITKLLKSYSSFRSKIIYTLKDHKNFYTLVILGSERTKTFKVVSLLVIFKPLATARLAYGGGLHERSPMTNLILLKPSHVSTN
ncbi:hypothetical protein BpHYR1_043746, partial [Brachionus plicatilis]